MAILSGAAIGLALVTAWYLGVYQDNVGSVSGVMGQMMGKANAIGMLRPMPSAVWAALLLLSAAAIAGVAGLAYYMTYPQISARTDDKVLENQVKLEPGLSWSVLVRSSKPEEKKVLEVLAAHGGKYLQKFVVKESGLSKLKTHRILSRFTERGVVIAEKKGNTNEISLAPWLLRDVSATSSASELDSNSILD